MAQASSPPSPTDPKPAPVVSPGLTLAVGIGFLALVVVAKFERERIPFQHWLVDTWAITGEAFLAFGTLVLLWRWGNVPGVTGRRPLVHGVTAAWVYAAGVQGFLAHVGYLRGPSFWPPVPVQMLVYGSAMAGTVAAFLTLYRVFPFRSRGHAFGAYLALVVMSGAVTALGDQRYLDARLYLFRKGYSVTADVVNTVLLYVIPWIVYEVSWRREAQRNPVASGAGVASGARTRKRRKR